MDNAVFTYTDEVLLQALSTLYSVTTPPMLVINTKDLNKEALISFKLTVFSRSTPSDSLTHEILFDVYLNPNNPCIPGLAGIPADNAYDMIYKAHSAAGLIDFTGINNGSCSFKLELLDSSTGLAADPTIFTFL